MKSSAHLRGQVLGGERAGEADRLAHLGQVLGAVRAAGQVRLEPAPVGRGQRALQVVGDQLDGLLADEVATERESQELIAGLPELGLEDLPQPAAAAVQQDPLVALADRPARCRPPRCSSPRCRAAVTTSRWRAGRSSMPARMRSASLPASSRSSASSIQCSGGSAQPPAPSNRAGSTAGPGIGDRRRCAAPVLPVVLARLTRMRNSQVCSDERPSKPSRPRSTAEPGVLDDLLGHGRGSARTTTASRSIGSW